MRKNHNKMYVLYCLWIYMVGSWLLQHLKFIYCVESGILNCACVTDTKCKIIGSMRQEETFQIYMDYFKWVFVPGKYYCFII